MALEYFCTGRRAAVRDLRHFVSMLRKGCYPRNAKRLAIGAKQLIKHFVTLRHENQIKWKKISRSTFVESHRQAQIPASSYFHNPAQRQQVFLRR